MFAFRRAALRATSSIAAASSRPRTFTSLSTAPSPFRPRQQKWLSAPIQRRFNSEDSNAAARPAEEKTTDETVPEAPSASEEATAAEASNSTSTESSSSADQPTVAETVSSAAETVTQKTGDAFDAAAAAVGGAAAEAVSGEKQQEDRRQFVASSDGKRTLYVGNLFYQTQEDQLRQEFSRFGNIVKTTIIRDPAGLSRGFGYVEFENDDSAAVAIVQMNQRVIDGRRLTVQHHRRREQTDQRPRRRNEGRVNPPSKTLFIGNMSFEMSDRDLNDLFRNIRNVLDVRVAIDRRTGQPRGFAHADFIDETSATKAKELLSQKELYGRRLRVDYTESNKTNQPK
ncbi:hypothetical protein B0J12DRAFT_649346 [Macrophomina phaseolina]|uniref:RRM domain-containing protein n=1 Tax=Macrophomina phaseolina TaxID=35725 RepID=A0ABQ8GME2_9PEZI|nr:hypothetical protein B0J12DRAFT_649346 [Macrophomina phaseolina]